MNRKRFVVLGVLGFVLSLAAVGCGKQATATTAPASTTGPQLQATPASVETAASTVGPTNSGIQWPSKMPTDVPQFTYGTITGSNNNVMGSIQAAYKNVSKDAFTKYKADLKAAGWKITNATQSADGFEIDAAKAPRGVVAMFINSKNDGLKGAITYNDKSGQ
jgi:hypothetical protein